MKAGLFFAGAIGLAATALAIAAQAQDKVEIGIAQPNLEHPYRVGGTERARWAARGETPRGFERRYRWVSGWVACGVEKTMKWSGRGDPTHMRMTTHRTFGTSPRERLLW